MPELWCKQFAENKKGLLGLAPLSFAAQNSNHIAFIQGSCSGAFLLAICADRSHSTRWAVWTVTHGCSRSRGTSQGDMHPERGLCPCHSSLKPCPKTHPRCQHHSKQPEPASFALNLSNSPLLCCQAARARQQVKSSALPARSFSLSARRENEEFNRVSSYCLPLDFRLRAGDEFLAVSVKRGLKNGKKMFE